MPNTSRKVVLIPISTKTSTGASGDCVMPEWATGVIIKLKCDAGTGTSPTLDVKIQQKLPTAGASDLEGGINPSGTDLYDDYAAFTQITTGASTQILRIVGGGGQGTTQPTAASDGALTAGTVRNGPIGSVWRMKWVIGGTNPSFANLQATAVFIS